MSLYDVAGGTSGGPSDLNQVVDAMNGANDVNFTAFAALSAPSAPTVAVNAISGVLTGNYQYALAHRTGYWQGPVGTGTYHNGNTTGGGTLSAVISPNAQQATVDIPGAPTGVGYVDVYRTEANGSILYYLTSVLANTSTSISDNTPDSGLGVEMPTTNTTGGKFIGDGSQLTGVISASQIGETVASLVDGQVPESQLGNVPPVNVATTTQAGTVLVSAAPTSGNPVAVSTTDPAYEAISEGNYVESFNERMGPVTLEGSDVTTALGFTPANAATTPTEGANTFTGNQTAPAFVASGLTGATVGARFVGGTTGGAPASGTWNPGDLATDENGNIYVYSQPQTETASVSEPIGLVVSGYSANEMQAMAIEVSQNVTVTAFSIATATAGLPIYAGLYNSSGVLLGSAGLIEVTSSGNGTTFNLTTPVTLQANTIYYIEWYSTSASMTVNGTNTGAATTVTQNGVTFTFTYGGKTYYGTTAGFVSSAGTADGTNAWNAGLTYQYTVPAQWVKPNPIGSMGIEFEVANLMNGFDLYSTMTSASNPTTTAAIYNVWGSSSSNNPSHQPTPLIQNVNSNAEYCFEAEINNGTSSGSYTAYAGLWDLTANALVAGSTISTTIYSNAQGQTLRSGAITLIPGHQYAVTVWSSSSSSSSMIYSARIVGQM